MKIKKLLGVLIVGFAMLLCGCNEISQTDEEYIPPEYTRLAYPVTVEGIVFDNSPQAIVCLSPTLADMLYELGAWDKVVAANISEGSVLYPDTAGVTRCSGAVNPDIEEILSYSPDLVLTSTPMGAMDIKKITDSGIKYLYIPLATDISSMMEMYSMLAIICYGDIDAMQKVDEVLAPMFEAFEENISQSASMDFAVLQTDSFFLATEDTFISSVLSEAYGDNVVEGTEYSGDLSQLSELAPDIVFLSSELSESEVSGQISLPEDAYTITFSCDEKITTATQAAELVKCGFTLFSND